MNDINDKCIANDYSPLDFDTVCPNEIRDQEIMTPQNQRKNSAFKHSLFLCDLYASVVKRFYFLFLWFNPASFTCIHFNTFTYIVLLRHLLVAIHPSAVK